ncbi:MAG: hypothetical protein PHR36_02940 [Patescibacteria group bacterium]|nr:hypothetical protein [Patescibacteria group bacterium]
MEWIIIVYLITHADKEGLTWLGWLLERWVGKLYDKWPGLTEFRWLNKLFWVANPGMTWRGKRRIKKLRFILKKLLPDGPAAIYCGTGKRNRDVAKCLGHNLKDIYFSDIWGGPATLVKVGIRKMVILADGTLVDYKERFLSSKDLGDAAKDAIKHLLSGSVIDSGRPTLLRVFKDILEAEECQNGAIYKISIFSDGKIEVEVAVKGIFLEDAKTRKAAAHV